MKKQATTPRSERQLRFAEAGVLFVLVLGIAIFVGVRFQGSDEEAVVAATPAVTVETAPVVAVVIDSVSAESVPGIVIESPEPAPPVVVTYTMAEQAYFAGAYAEATDLFSSYTADHPANAWGHYMLGLSAWKAGDPEAADASFVAALEIKPDHLKSLINDARVLLDLDRDIEAATRISTALDVDPVNADARRVQARVFHRQGRIDEAIDAYTTILRDHGDDAWALNNLGLLMIEQERFDDALAPLAKAANLQDAACIQNNLAIALERTGHYTAAGAAYERALESDSGHERAEASLERVATLVEDPTLDPVDLTVLASEFRIEPDQPTLAAAEYADGMDLAVAAVLEAVEAEASRDEATATEEIDDER